MKNLILSLMLMCLSTLMFGQSPAKFNYQAVLRDVSHQPISGQQVNIKMNILENGANGIVVYEETHQVTTTSNGVVNLLIGTGQNQTGDFSQLDWQQNHYWLQVELDDSGSSNYTVIGTNQLVSVPYALHAETASNVDDADANPINELQQLSFDPNTNELSISNGNSIVIPTGGSDADADPTNEIQGLSSEVDETLVTININKGGQGTSFDIADPDPDPSNELQNLSLNGNMLEIGQGNSVDLSAFNSFWKPSTSWDPGGIFYEGGVYMDTVSIDWQLMVGNNNPYGTQIFDSDIYMNDNQNDRSLSLSAQRALFEDGQGISKSEWNRDSLTFSYDGGGLVWPLTANYNAGGIQLGSLLDKAYYGATGLNFRNEKYDSYMTNQEWIVNQILTPSDIFERFSIRPDSLKFFNEAKWQTVQLGTNRFLDHGYLNLYDGAGNMNASIGTNHLTIVGEPVNTGGLQLFSENNLTVQLESLVNGGFLNMYRKDGTWISTLGSDLLGRGSLTLHDLDGSNIISLTIDEFGRGRMSAKGSMNINDDQGRLISAADEFGFSIWNPESGDLMGGLEFMFTDDITGMVYTTGANSLYNFLAGPNVADDKLSNGFAGVFDENGISRAGMKVDGENRGSFYGENYSLTGSSGKQRAVLHTQGSHDAGSLLLYGPNGNLNTSLDYNGLNYNFGDITIYDDLGAARAGLFIDAITGIGQLFADVKHFKTDHPEDENKEIWYASIEGPEAATYLRGTARLIDGEAFVAFPDHFRFVSNTETMTTILTPQHWDTFGLAVVEKTTEGIYVKELKGGQGNFAFDWEVKCVRLGFEDYKVIREKQSNLHKMNVKKENKKPSMSDYRTRLQKTDQIDQQSNR